MEKRIESIIIYDESPELSDVRMADAVFLNSHALLHMASCIAWSAMNDGSIYSCFS